MPASTDQLLDAVERTLFVYPEVPGLVTDIRIQGVLGRESPVSHPVANLVGCAVLDEADADATISAVRDRFAEGAKSFGWVTSPSSRPHDLPQRLLEAGLVKADELAGMALTDLETPIRANPEVEVRQASADEQRRAIPMVGNAYGMPPDVAEWFTEALIGAEHLRCAMYHAYLPDHQGPVAFGNLVFVPRTSIVLLGGAGTLGDLRGRGVYTSLVARRLADARAAGADAAVIQAVRGTSAPVCAKLGFQEILPLDFYAWVPPGVEMDLHA
ncbi:MAG TPA: hypothetical protein VEL12_07395 [Candidatus Nitrosopolaris sp.]|nr:hypothetical protein [Candidatus Nitrosopolaris sp.]